MKRNAIFKALIIVLSIHILSVHTKLLYYLNPEVEEKISFSVTNMDEYAWFSILFALAYSIGTAIIIYITKKRWMILTYAIADGLAVLLYYFTKIPIEVSAVYFAMYTFFLIASTTWMEQREEDIEVAISRMTKGGMKQKDMARKLNVSESTMSRLLRKLNLK